jgi:serine/threonine protein kinase
LSFPHQDLVIAGRFRVRSQVGYATLGWLYRALDAERGQEVALRLVLSAADSDAACSRLAAQIERIRKLGDLRGLASVYECGQHARQLWFTSEWVAGESVESALARVAAMEPTDAARVGVEVAEALADAHNQGVCHGAVKTRNIFITAQGTTKVLELGVADAIFPSSTLLANTPASAPPEVILGSGGDHRSDIYSLGCVLFTAVVGRPPFGGGLGPELMAAHVGFRAPRARSFNPAVPEGFELILLRAMARQPEDRYQTMGEFKAELSRWLVTQRAVRP